MSEIKERLDKVRALIQESEFLEGKGLSNEVNIRIFCYEPENEMVVRHFVNQLETDQSLDCHLIVCNLYKIFLDFHALGREIKRKREEKGWTQEYLAQLVDRTPRSIMYMENRGQKPSLNVFYQLVTLLEISVDQFFFPDKLNGESTCRKQIDVMLNTMDEKELTVMKYTAEGLQRARETEDA